MAAPQFIHLLIERLVACFHVLLFMNNNNICPSFLTITLQCPSSYRFIASLLNYLLFLDEVIYLPLIKFHIPNMFAAEKSNKYDKIYLLKPGFVFF